MKLRVLSPAQEEFSDAAAFYEKEAAGLGAEFVDEFERALNLIAAHPHLGAPFGGDSRRKLLRRFPFQVIYEVHQEEVLILALAHLRRRPDYWKERPG